MSAESLVAQMKTGLDAPICLTWELTYACNLQCVHCLSSSGQRDPRELTTAEAKRVLDELHDLQVFYINIGGGEPMVRRDFFELVEYAIGRSIGVKFSTNGAFIDADKARRFAAMDYLDIQISLDGIDEATNDAVRGPGSYRMARTAMDHLRDAGFGPFKISVVVTRHNVDQLDGFQALADSYGAQLRITRLRPSGRGADTWHELHPTNAQQRQIYEWLLAKGESVLTGDSFFHLNALGDSLPGLNMCGAGRVVCLIDPIGDVYACPFVIHDEFKAGSVRDDGGFTRVWKQSELFTSLRELDLGHTKLTDEGLAHLSRPAIAAALSGLGTLDLSSGKQYSAAGLRHVAADPLGVAVEPAALLAQVVAARLEPGLVADHHGAADDQQRGQRQAADQELEEHRDAELGGHGGASASARASGRSAGTVSRARASSTRTLPVAVGAMPARTAATAAGRWGGGGSSGSSTVRRSRSRSTTTPARPAGQSITTMRLSGPGPVAGSPSSTPRSSTGTMSPRRLNTPATHAGTRNTRVIGGTGMVSRTSAIGRPSS